VGIKDLQKRKPPGNDCQTAKKPRLVVNEAGHGVGWTGGLGFSVFGGELEYHLFVSTGDSAL